MNISPASPVSLENPAALRRRARRTPRWSAIEPLEQRIAPATFTVTNITDTTAAGSLRAALLNAASTTGIDTIIFNIPGTGVHKISLTSALPAINEGVIIDGYTQPGASASSINANTGTNAVLTVEIDGTSAGNGASGFVIQASNTKITGLVINHFSGAGINIFSSPSNSAVEGNFIGTNAAGTAAAANGVGIQISSGSNASLKGNLISGNSGPGISSSYNSGTQILGNVIGTMANGVTALGNGGAGIDITDATTETIGGTTAGQGNLIAYNNGDGLHILQSSVTTNAVRGNFIFGNTGLGINLTGFSDPTPVTPNDLGDGDSGANNLQNFPVITTVERSPTAVFASGTFNSTPNTTFALDFFSSTTADPSGFGEGQFYLGSVNVTTNSTGNATFTFTGTQSIFRGSVVTATATNPALGVTSEFSSALTATPLIVTTAADVVNPSDALTSLREALNFANAASDANTITFAIPGATGAVQTLQPTSTLPIIQYPTIIDGFSQNGAAGPGSGLPTALKIQLDGSLAGASAHGLYLGAGGSSVAGLAIGNFGGAGVFIGLSGNASSPGGTISVTGDYLGTNSAGTLARPNHDGLVVDTASPFTVKIGETISGSENVISGNTVNGLLLNGSNVTVKNNYIGVDVSGSSALGNGAAGIRIYGASNQIGTNPGTNIISGNPVGVELNGSGARDNVLVRNRIGTDPAGTSVPTGSVQQIGVLVLNAGVNNQIGTSPTGFNLIAGNAEAGIKVQNSAQTKISNNFIGLSFPDATFPTGKALPNGTLTAAKGAVRIEDSSQVTVADNVISGNATSGIFVGAVSSTVTGVNIFNNQIGTDSNGQVAKPNTGDGVIFDKVSNSRIDQNLISANTQAGITLTGVASFGNTLVDNYLGVDASGTGALGNGSAGVHLLAAAHNNVITSVNRTTIIAGNTLFGVHFEKANNNTVELANLGAGSSGGALPNGQHGVLINAGATGNLVGGTAAKGNFISSNGGAGVAILDSGTSGNTVSGNSIENNATGVRIDGASNNVIGSSSPANGNRISGQTGDGVVIANPGATGNTVRGNLIGLNAAGTGPQGNGGAGIHLTDTAGNTLGATDGLSGNRIGGNSGDGILSDTASRYFVLGSPDGGANYQDPSSSNFLALQTGEGTPFTTLYSSGQTISFTISGAFVPGDSFLEIRLWNLNAAQAGQQVASLTFDGVTQSGLGAFESSGNGPGFIESYYFGLDPTLLTDGVLNVSLKLATLPVGQSVGIDYANLSITPASNNTIVGNTIGSIAAGPTVNTAANGGDGIHLVNSLSSQIGNGTVGGRNVIGKNSGAGISLEGGGDHTIQGNYLGLSATGSAAANSTGISVQDSGQNQIGGALAGQGNIISGNGSAGVQVLGFSSGNVLRGNFIGLNASGDTALSNGVGVIFANGAQSNQLGTSESGGGNIISGNTGDGVQISGSNTSGNSVLNNDLGFNAAGDDTLPNGGDGLTLDGGAHDNFVGGSGSSERNFISGNGGDGVSLYDGGTTGNLIEGNFIGTTLDGTAAAANGSAGVSLHNGASTNTLRGNLLSGNLFDGVLISDASSTGNLLLGNFIGTDFAGTSPVANGGDGVHIQNGATGTQIGGLTTSDGNTIANNDQYGIYVEAGSNGHSILGNSLHDNALEGILLATGSPSGGNHDQPAPTLTAAYLNPNGILFRGQFSTAPNTSYRLEFFTPDGIDAAHNNSSEGQTLLGTLTVISNSAGVATFSQVLPLALAEGDLVTATATALDGSSAPVETSQFSTALAVTPPPPLLSISGAAVTEGTSGTSIATFTVTLSQASTNTITVDYASTVDPSILLVAAAGLAIAGDDFQSVAGQLSFAPGELTKTVQVTVNGDLTPEARERFAIQLTNSTNSIIEQALGVGVIRDDDHHLFAVAAGTGSKIQVFDATDGSLSYEFAAFEARYQGGVRVATGDVNGDGVNDIIAATGQGGKARVRVFDGLTGERFTGLFSEFRPFGGTYRGGLNVATGDVNGDGFADLIVSPSAGSRAAIHVFDGQTGALLFDIQALAKVSGGIRVAAGDVNGDGLADLIATSGTRGEVRIFDAATGAIHSTFQAYEPSYRGGLYVSAGDLDGDGLDDIVVGTSSGRSQIRGFLTGSSASPLQFNPFTGPSGIRVGIVDVNSDGIADIIAAQGSGSASKVRLFDGQDQSELLSFAAISSRFRGGIFVA